MIFFQVLKTNQLSPIQANEEIAP